VSKLQHVTLYGAKNFEVASRGLENLSISALNHLGILSFNINVISITVKDTHWHIADGWRRFAFL